MRLGTEYRWILEGYTPDTIPMVRLAEYMQQFAKLLGQEPSVHFERVEKGSVALVSRIDGVAAGRVSARLRVVGQRNAPFDVMRTYHALNAMLAQDRTTALIKEGSAVVIRFPGKHVETRAVVEIPDTGSVVGYLYMLSEGKNAYHARIRLESGSTLMCTVSSDIARQLRDHLFDAVKVSGAGVWARSADGAWTVTSLDIRDVMPADPARLRAIVERLRELEIAWPDDPLSYLDDLNDGEGGTIQ